MAEFTSPSEIARETLRQLALRRTPPTPDNYYALYNEIAGTQGEEAFPEKALKAMLPTLPQKTAEQKRYSRQLEAAVTEKSWSKLKDALSDIFTRGGGEPLAWAPVLRDLVKQLDTNSSGLTSTKKRESLEHVLRTTSSPEMLHQRLQSIVSNWAQTPLAEANTLVDEIAAEEPIAAKTPGAVSPTQTAASISGELQELMARLLEDAVSLMLSDTPDLVTECGQVASAIRTAKTPRQVDDVTAKLKKFSFRLSFVAEDQSELKAALFHLIHLIVENIGELVVDDQWLHGQIAAVNQLVQQPLNIRTLDDMERRLKDVIYKQSTLKHNLLEARNRLKVMLATFVDRLANISATTGDYHDKIEGYASRISKANDITEISDVLDEVLRETRGIQSSTAKSRDELRDMRQRVGDAEQEITRLQNELDHTSELVRLDPLTGALNRKGLGEALEREVARNRRHDGLLSIAMLDIDNFKKLNDNLGHKAGDEALVHLAKITQNTLRPQDTLARYGGEEFVILLPDTSLNDAVTVMTRVQRELTRNFFLYENNKLLITFSAGVAEMSHEESPEQTVERADKAMYLAKRAGKNRVMAA